MNLKKDYLFYIDEKNYKENGTKFERVAVRAVIKKGNKYALIQSAKYGEYKFPGGGMKKGEELKDTLIREVKEETGLNAIPASLKLIGKVLERRKGEVEDLFEITSYYYEAAVEDEIGARNLDDYEKDYGYELVYVTLEVAIHNNEQIADISEIPWVKRDTKVMHYLM